MHDPSVVIVGAGPAGLTAAYELVQHGIQPIVYEGSSQVGGLARTETYRGHRFDIGGHRFYTSVPEIQDLWERMLGSDFIRVPRLSRIYYNGRFFNYPLSAYNALNSLGLIESLRIVGSYCKARLFPAKPEETFDDWVANRFGARLFRTFFKTYTEKVWGIPCSEICADWAAQRIKGLSLATAILNMIFGSTAPSLIEEFHYPRLGPGQMWERFKEEIERGGGRVQLNSRAVAFRHDGRCVQSVTLRSADRCVEARTKQLITSAPLAEFIKQLNPAAPADVQAAANSLKYRDFIVVTLIVNQPQLFPDNWIYIHTPHVRVGRIQNFKNWSQALVPDQAKTAIGLEYFCTQEEDLWQMDDARLIELAGRELEQLGLARVADVEDGCVTRQPKAYPVYDAEYRRHLEVVRCFLATFVNLQTIGRNGMHRYNNQDHSMLCGLYAARNLLGAAYDLWEVNTARSYYEEQRVPGNGQSYSQRVPAKSFPGASALNGCQSITSDGVTTAQC
jgi:protoporphyrinogen oxidase